MSEIGTPESTDALFALFTDILDNPGKNDELASKVAEAINLMFSFKPACPPSEEQAHRARSFLMTMYGAANTEEHRSLLVCAMRGVGDQSTADFLSTIAPFEGAYVGLEKSARQAIRKRLQAI